MIKNRNIFIKTLSFYFLFFSFFNCEEKEIKETIRFPTKDEMNMDYREQIKNIKELVDEDLDSTLYNYQLARLYFLIEEYDNSFKHLNKNLVVGGIHGPSYALAVHLFIEQNDYNKASQYINTTINLGVKTVDILFFKSLIHYHFQEHDSALLYINKALDKTKTKSEKLLLHKAEVLLAKEDTISVRSLLSPFIQSDSTNKQYKMMLFRLESKARNYSAALKLIQEIIALSAIKKRDLTLKLAATYEHLGERKKSFRVLEEFFAQTNDLEIGKIVGEKYLSFNLLNKAFAIYQEMKLLDSLDNNTKNLLLQLWQRKK